MEKWCCSIITSYYPVRSGSSNGGNYCGAFCVLAHNIANNAYWGIGAALYVHIMLCVAVVLAMVHIVDHSMLMLMILLVMPIGIMVLLYYASYYVRRGGNTSDGNGCGIFNVLCVLADGAFWPIGAALLIYTLYYSWWLF